MLALLAEATAGAPDAETAAASAARALADRVRGPYALAFYCAAARTLLYCRDPFGRRSLVVQDESVASAAPRDDGAGWAEVTTQGVHYVRGCAAWPSVLLRCPRAGRRPARPWREPGPADAAKTLGAALAASAVKRRCAGLREVAVLFSGGLDSVVLARLAHDALPADATIDLINVAFGERRGDAEKAPDRLAARCRAHELRRACPSRKFRLIEATAGPGTSHASPTTSPRSPRPARRTWISTSRRRSTWPRRRGRPVRRHRGERTPTAAATASTACCATRRTPSRKNSPTRRADGAEIAAHLVGKAAKARCVSGLCGGCCRRKGRGDAAYACGAHPKRLTYAEKCARADERLRRRRPPS